MRKPTNTAGTASRDMRASEVRLEFPTREAAAKFALGLAVRAGAGAQEFLQSESHALTPGILGASTARKKSTRSASSRSSMRGKA